MRLVQLYLVFVFFILLIVSSGHSDNQQTYSNISSGLLLDLNNDDCIASADYFSLKKTLPELSFFRIINEKMIEGRYNLYVNLIGDQFLPLRWPKQMPLILKLPSPNEKDESHFLTS